MSGRKRPASLASSSDAQPKKRKPTTSLLWKNGKKKAIRRSTLPLTTWHLWSAPAPCASDSWTRIFNSAFIDGSKNIFLHAATDMHKRAMILFHKSQLNDVAEYALIARALSTIIIHIIYNIYILAESKMSDWFWQMSGQFYDGVTLCQKEIKILS